MTKVFLRVLFLVVLVAACSPTANTDTTLPPPAAESEIAAFCVLYEEVRELDYAAKYTALLDVAPAELEGSLFRMLNNPGPTDDDLKVTGFINDHCRS